MVANHDRAFLENVCATVVDLDPSHFGVDGDGGNRFSGSYSDYLAAKRDARLREAAFAEEQDEARRPPARGRDHRAQGSGTTALRATATSSSTSDRARRWRARSAAGSATPRDGSR